MQVEAAKKLVSDFADLGGNRLVVTGGEPLTHPGCGHILRESKRHGLQNSMFSMAIDESGSPICQSTADQYASLVDEWFVSIHSSKAESHDAMTNKAGSWEGTLDAVKSLVRAGIRVNANFVVHPGNVDEIPNVARLCGALGIRELRVLTVVLQGRAANNHSWSVQAGRVAEAMSKAGERSDVIVRLGEASRAFFRQPSACMAIQQEIVINWDGWISPCHAWEPRPSTSLLDNAIITPLQQVLIDSPRLRSCRQATLKSEFRGCANGCLAREFLISSDTNAPALSLIS